MRLIDVDAIRVRPEYLENICGIVMIRAEDLARILNEQPTIPFDTKLKEQEPKPVGKEWNECPSCGKVLSRIHDMHYCGVCGQAVKWE